MTRVLLTIGAGALCSGLLGYLLLPLLRALKAGQSVPDIGPTWHNAKVGTPLMGGLMFVGASVVCLLVNLPAMENYTVLYVLALSLCFGLIGFLDDFFKVKFKRDLGLTSFQKAALQMAVSAVFLYILYMNGTITGKIAIPFTGLSFTIHPILYIFFAMFVMVGCVNAVNLTDGVDGLCGTVTIPVMVFLAVAAIAAKQGLASVSTTVLNRQARIFGDAAVAAMSISGKIFMIIVICYLDVMKFWNSLFANHK